jgi:hypothetical protein
MLSRNASLEMLKRALLVWFLLPYAVACNGIETICAHCMYHLEFCLALLAFPMMKMLCVQADTSSSSMAQLK